MGVGTVGAHGREPTVFRGRSVSILLAVAAAFLPGGEAASAKGPPPIAVQQYIEHFPTGSGSVSVGKGTARPAVALPNAVAARLRATGGSDAAALEKIATAPSLGAPQRPAVRPPRATPKATPRAAPRGRPASPKQRGGPPASAIGEVSSTRDGEGRTSGALRLALLLLLPAGAFAALRLRALRRR